MMLIKLSAISLSIAIILFICFEMNSYIGINGMLVEPFFLIPIGWLFSLFSFALLVGYLLKILKQLLIKIIS